MRTRKYSDEVILEAIKINTCFGDAIKSLGLCQNDNNAKYFKAVAAKNNLSLDHFDLKAKQRKYPWITKKCPVCTVEFKTQDGHSKSKTVCSRACSNTFFRSGKDHANYDHDKERYRDICFAYWPKKCALCDWYKVVDVHHIDGNHGNNDIMNLIPICPNEHRLLNSSEYRQETEEKIEEAMEKFWKRLTVDD